MCGGIGFKISRIPKSELAKFYGEEKATLLLKKERLESKFWDERPVLPVLQQNNQVMLFDWGNRSKNINLPQTGWAKRESLESGKWDYLNPEQVRISADRGYEKGVWFDVAGYIAGIKIHKDGIERVYIQTKPASDEYNKMTKHDREPVILNQKSNIKI